MPTGDTPTGICQRREMPTGDIYTIKKIQSSPHPYASLLQLDLGKNESCSVFTTDQNIFEHQKTSSPLRASSGRRKVDRKVHFFGQNQIKRQRRIVDEFWAGGAKMQFLPLIIFVVDNFSPNSMPWLSIEF